MNYLNDLKDNNVTLFLYDEMKNTGCEWKMVDTSHQLTKLLTNGLISLGFQPKGLSTNSIMNSIKTFYDKNGYCVNDNFMRLLTGEQIDVKFAGKTMSAYVKKALVKKANPKNNPCIGLITLESQDKIITNISYKGCWILEYKLPSTNTVNKSISFIVKCNDCNSELNVEMYDKKKKVKKVVNITPKFVSSHEEEFVTDEIVQYQFNKYRPHNMTKLIVVDEEDREDFNESIKKIDRYNESYHVVKFVNTLDFDKELYNLADAGWRAITIYNRGSDMDTEYGIEKARDVLAIHTEYNLIYFQYGVELVIGKK